VTPIIDGHEDHVFGRCDRVRSELMGARREGIHA
jgi:hypothetical protein